MTHLDTVVLAAVALAVVWLIGQWVYRRMRPYHQPAVIPDALPVVDSISGMALLPGAIAPYEMRRPETQAVFIDALKRGRLIAIAPDPPRPGRIICAARVTDARRDGAVVHAVAQGVARVRLIAQQPSGEWSVGLIVDAAEAKTAVRSAVEELRQLALRALEGQDPFPGGVENLRAVVDPTELIDLAAVTCGLRRETQSEILATESLPARLAIVRRSIEALTRR